MVHHGGQLVVQQVVVQGLAGLFVEQQLFGKAVADAHGHTAMDLCLRQGGVDEAAAVMDIDDAFQRYLAHGNVYLHLREGAAEGIGVGADGGGALRRDMLGVDRVILGGHGQMGQIHLHRAAVLADYIALHDVQFLRRTAQHLGGIGQYFLPQEPPGLVDGEALHVGLAAGVSA